MRLSGISFVAHPYGPYSYMEALDSILDFMKGHEAAVAEPLLGSQSYVTDMPEYQQAAQRICSE